MWRNYSRFVYLSDVGQDCMAMASIVLFNSQSCTCSLGTHGSHCTPFIGLHAHIHTSHGQPLRICPNAWRCLTLRHSRGNSSLLHVGAHTLIGMAARVTAFDCYLAMSRVVMISA